nr:S Protein Homologue 26 [Arabidopsis thaliana]
MNRLSILLFVFAFGLTMMSNTALSYKHSVWIRNFLHEKNDLIIHCKSTNHDMVYHRLHPTGSYHLLVDDDSDYFWCHLWQGPNFKHHQVFGVNHGDVWEAREDGIYFSQIKYARDLRQHVFMYGWNVPLTLSRASSLGLCCVSLSLLLSSLVLFYFYLVLVLKFIFFIMNFKNLIFICVGIFLFSL